MKEAKVKALGFLCSILCLAIAVAAGIMAMGKQNALFLTFSWLAVLIATAIFAATISIHSPKKNRKRNTEGKPKQE